MGGFELYGPSYKIYKTNGEFCYCFGYVSTIDEKTEKVFIEKDTKEITKLNFQLIFKDSENFHTGEELMYKYEFKPRNKEEENKDVYLKQLFFNYNR